MLTEVDDETVDELLVQSSKQGCFPVRFHGSPNESRIVITQTAYLNTSLSLFVLAKSSLYPHFFDLFRSAILCVPGVSQVAEQSFRRFRMWTLNTLCHALHQLARVDMLEVSVLATTVARVWVESQTSVQLRFWCTRKFPVKTVASYDEVDEEKEIDPDGNYATNSHRTKRRRRTEKEYVSHIRTLLLYFYEELPQNELNDLPARFDMLSIAPKAGNTLYFPAGMVVFYNPVISQGNCHVYMTLKVRALVRRSLTPQDLLTCSLEEEPDLHPLELDQLLEDGDSVKLLWYQEKLWNGMFPGPLPSWYTALTPKECFEYISQQSQVFRDRLQEYGFVYFDVPSLAQYPLAEQSLSYICKLTHMSRQCFLREISQDPSRWGPSLYYLRLNGVLARPVFDPVSGQSSLGYYFPDGARVWERLLPSIVTFILARFALHDTEPINDLQPVDLMLRCTDLSLGIRCCQAQEFDNNEQSIT